MDEKVNASNAAENCSPGSSYAAEHQPQQGRTPGLTTGTADPASLTGAAGEVARDAQSRIAGIAGDVKAGLAAAAEERKDDVAQALDDAAATAHRSAAELRGQDWLARLIECGAGELGALSTSLRSNDLQGLLGRIERLAREHPAVFVGAAVLVGFAAARLGKSVAAGASSADLPSVPGVLHGAN